MKYHFIHERGDYQPLAIEEMGSAWTSSIKKVVGYGESPAWFIYVQGKTRIYSLEKVHQKIIDYLWRKINTDKKYLSKVASKLVDKSDIFLRFIGILKEYDLKKISNRRLIDLKKKFHELHLQTVPYGEPVPYFLKDKLQQELTKLFNEKKMTPSDTEVLLEPVEISFLDRQQLALYKLRKIKDKSRLDRELQKHAKEYDWVYFDYSGRIQTINNFQQQLRDLKKKPPRKKNPSLISRKKKKIIAKYGLGKKADYLIHCLDRAYWLMDYKKEVFSRANAAITPFYQEAGRRVGLPLSKAYWFWWREIRQALRQNKKIPSSLAKKRSEFSVVLDEKGHMSFLSPVQARKITKDISRDQQPDSAAGEIRGMSGSPGRVKGRIRYLASARECSKMKEGEILLVSNTTPDFMPAIGKAKAIVTNEGGMTCHAAIVSRELKIPCVVGTRNATRVFKTGDKVMVEATIGRVKKI